MLRSLFLNLKLNFRDIVRCSIVPNVRCEIRSRVFRNLPHESKPHVIHVNINTTYRSTLLRRLEIEQITHRRKSVISLVARVFVSFNTGNSRSPRKIEKPTEPKNWRMSSYNTSGQMTAADRKSSGYTVRVRIWRRSAVSWEIYVHSYFQENSICGTALFPLTMNNINTKRLRNKQMFSFVFRSFVHSMPSVGVN